MKLNHIKALDGLRGISIFVVMIFHAGASFFQGGFVGVDVFFVLSGFLITSLLVLEFKNSGRVNIKNFYMRRILRLAPAFIFMLLIFCIGSALFLSNEAAYINYVDAVISFFYLSNWARAFSMHPPNFLGHTWSLSIEEQFYVIWPITILILLRNIKNINVTIFVAAIIALGSFLLRIFLLSNNATPERIYNGLDTRADSLMVGCIVALIFSSEKIISFFDERYRRVIAIASPIAIILLLLTCFFINRQDSWVYGVGFVFIEFFVVVILMDILLNKDSFVKLFLENKFLVWVGSISYGLYLWHYLIFRIMRAIGFNGIFILTLGALITFLIAVFSFNFIEVPILRLKKNFPAYSK